MLSNIVKLREALKKHFFVTNVKPPLTPFRLTKEPCWTVPPCSYLYGRPALGSSCTEFSTLDAGILIM